MFPWVQVLDGFLSKMQETKADDMSKQTGGVKAENEEDENEDEDEIVDDEELPRSGAGSHRDAWMRLLTIPRRHRQLFVGTVIVCLNKVRRLPSRIRKDCCS